MQPPGQQVEVNEWRPMWGWWRQSKLADLLIAPIKPNVSPLVSIGRKECIWVWRELMLCVCTDHSLNTINVFEGSLHKNPFEHYGWAELHKWGKTRIIRNACNIWKLNMFILPFLLMAVVFTYLSPCSRLQSVTAAENTECSGRKNGIWR